jgi:hypothetical protein
MVNAVRLMARDRLHASDCKRILLMGGRFLSLERTGQNIMYRIVAFVIGGLALAACSSTPDWANLDALKPAPVMDTVRFESTPPGAEAKTSNGQTCRTPCALALPTSGPLTVTFSLNGYQPTAEDIEPISNNNGFAELRPNPVQVELTPAPPPLKPVKKPAASKKTSAKPATKPKPKPKTSAAPATAPRAQQQAPAPWPPAPAR